MNHDLIDAEHDTETHTDSSTWLLFLWPQHRLGEREQNVEDDGEAESPVNLYVWVIGQVDCQVVTSVLVSASTSFKAIFCLNYFLVSFQVFWIVVLLLGLFMRNF